MIFDARFDDDTLAIFDGATGEQLDALAVIPNHMPDLEKLVAEMSPDIAWQLARMADARAIGF
jgi:hypothetical protein